MPPQRRTAALTAVVLVVAVVLGIGLGVAGYSIAWSARKDSRPTPSPVPTPSALAAAGASPTTSPPPSAAPPAAAGVAAVLQPHLADPRLGGRVLAQVADADAGTVLLDDGAATAGTPASTAKLATAVALLSRRPATDRLSTTVVAGAAPGSVVLVGAGDPTLSAAAPGTATSYQDAARLSDLANGIRDAGVQVSAVTVDGSLFSGPTASPAWGSEDVPSDYASAITAVMADGGRDTPTAPIRSADPDLAAGQELAALLGVPGVPVTRGVAPVGARVLASVRSAPLGELVQQMLQQSDDVIAECLARLVVPAGPRTFDTAAAAVRTATSAVGVDIGAGLVDGSGLAASDRLTPAATVALLRLVAGPAGTALRSVVDGLPVAGWSGTLADRYLVGSARSAAGAVRAKTGTLTSVSALAGYVTDADGRLLVFAVQADQVGPTVADTDEAEAALDDLAAALAGCGCR